MPSRLCHSGRQLCQKAKKPKRKGKPTSPLMEKYLLKARRLSETQCFQEAIWKLACVQSLSTKAMKSWMVILEIRLPCYSKKPICPIIAFEAQSNTWQDEKSLKRLGVHSFGGKKKKGPLANSFDLFCSIQNFKYSLIKKISANKKMSFRNFWM